MRYFRRKNANGTWTWWASWTQGGKTVRRSTRCSTKSAAELVGARWERERADPVYEAANAATFGDEARDFVTACRGAVERGKMSTHTAEMYRQKAGNLVRIIGASWRLADVSESTFASYADQRRAEGVSESTLYKEWVTFSGIMRQAWRAQRYGRDPRSLKPAHFGPEYVPRATALTWEQVRKLLEVAPGERASAIAFALATGARRGEVFRAQAEDVDRKAWTVRIRGTKTEASARVVPVPRPMRRLLEIVELPVAPWENARRDLARYADAAGIPHVTWNDLRRTFASLLVQAGVAPHLVAKLLGHTTTAMVDRVYGRQTGESLAALVDAALRSPSVDQKKWTRQHKRSSGGHAKR